MDKIWFILISGKKEGPFSPIELRYDPRVTPDTLVWREGLRKWLPIRRVPELKIVFEDPKESSLGKKKPTNLKTIGKDELAIDLHYDYPPYLMWLLLIILIISTMLIYKFR